MGHAWCSGRKAIAGSWSTGKSPSRTQKRPASTRASYCVVAKRRLWIRALTPRLCLGVRRILSLRGAGSDEAISVFGQRLLRFTRNDSPTLCHAVEQGLISPALSSPPFSATVPVFMQVSRETRAFLLLTLVTMVWAGLMPTGKIALRGVPPMTIAAIRMVIGSSLLSLYLRRDSRPIPWSPRLAAGILALGFCGYMVSTGGSYYGLRLTTVTNAALLNAASPVSLALLSVMILKERLPHRSIAGILLSVLGVGVIITRGSWGGIGHSQSNLGAISL